MSIKLDKLNFFKGALLFILGISLVFSLSYYKKFTINERLVYRLELGKQSAGKSLILDTADQSIVKKIWQPDKVAVYAGSLKNPNAQQMEVIVKLLGFNDAEAKLKTSGSTGMLPDGTMHLNLRPHQVMHENPKLELNLSGKTATQYTRTTGVIQFVKSDGTLLSQVPVEVINSNTSNN